MDENKMNNQPENEASASNNSNNTNNTNTGWVFSENNPNPNPDSSSYHSSGEYHGTFQQDHNQSGYDSKYSYSSYRNPQQGQDNSYQGKVTDNNANNNNENYKWNYEDYRQHQQPRESARPKKNKGLRVFAMIMCGILCSGVVALAGYGVYSMVNTNITDPAISSPAENVPTAEPHLSLNDKPASAATTTISEDGVLSITERANKVQPSVVGIVAYYQSQNIFTGNQSQGSGIIASQDGYIITNAHVVSGATALKVVLHDNTEYTATLIGEDTKTDLAVIKIEASGLIPAEFGNSDQMQVGEQVITVGNPGGLELAGSITVGYVSALNRPISNTAGGTINCIQTDAAINPGNSGGALVNEYGQVIGINSQKIAATEFEGIGFAISINDAQPIIDDLISFGYVKGRVKIGVTIQEIDEFSARMYGYTPGVGVVSVEANSSAAQNGLVAGDIITQVDGEDATTNEKLSAILEKHKPGDTITLTVFRKSLQSYQSDKELKIQVVLAESVPDSAATTTQQLPTPNQQAPNQQTPAQ